MFRWYNPFTFWPMFWCIYCLILVPVMLILGFDSPTAGKGFYHVTLAVCDLAYAVHFASEYVSIRSWLRAIAD